MTIAVPTAKVVISLARKSGITADQAMNTFHYTMPSATPASGDYTNWITVYASFMNDMHAYFSNCMLGTPFGLEVQFYPLPANKPPPGTGLGPPIFTAKADWTAPTVQGLPAEVAACLTIDATAPTDSEQGPGNTRPAARKRNRKYFGPLAIGTLSTAAQTLESIFLPAFTQELVTRGISRLITGMADKGWGLQAFSNVNWATALPNNLTVDNAPDTQRRRGQAPTAKSSGAAPRELFELVNAQHRGFGLQLVETGFGGIDLVRA